MSAEPSINEKTRLSITLSSWWHVGLIIGTVMYWGFEINSSINADREQSERNNQQIVQLQLQMNSTEKDLLVFHQRYEDDMNRYIRDYSEPKRTK